MKISKYNIIPVFEKNIGQLPTEVKYKINANGYITFFTTDKLVLSLPSNIENTRNVFYMKLENSNINTQIQGKEKQNGIVNYFIGEDESNWITNIPIYSKIKYENVYENIDLYYYTNNGKVEYDFVLSQGASPEDISVGFEGVDNIEMDDNNNIVLTIGDIKAKLLKAAVYQIIDDVKININCKYDIDKNNRVKFLVSEYEKEYELVIDPVIELDYSTYIGGSTGETGLGIAIDEYGYAHITGYTNGAFPVTAGAYQTSFGGNTDAFVTKISPDGKGIVYSTYLGGSGSDSGSSIVVDNLGYAYVVGNTGGGFPVTTGAYQTTFGGNSDAFVTKLNLTGSALIYSTYLGGSSSDSAKGVAIDSDYNAYVVGYTSGNYPTTTGAYQTTVGGSFDVFVSKLNSSGSVLVYSTYIGGSGNDYGMAITVDEYGDSYITGYTTGSYPITSGTVQTKYGGNTDAFISKLNKYGSKLMYSTYLGGGGSDFGRGIAIDGEGCAYIVGNTTGRYPTVDGYQTIYGGGNNDIFVSKINEKGNILVYSTYLGGSGSDIGYGISIDETKSVYIVGSTTSSNYPTSKDAYQSIYGGNTDIVITRLSSDGKSLLYSTYLGGNSTDSGNAIAISNNGDIYVTGQGGANYPTTQGAYQTTLGGSVDCIVSKLAPIDINMTWSYTPSKAKVFDNIITNLNINNLSSTNIDIKIIYSQLDSSLSFKPNSLSIQGIKQSTTTIPSQIYLENIPGKENVSTQLSLKYVKEQLQGKIPLGVSVEVYYNKVLLNTVTKQFYINTKIGPDYIPGCSQLYNLEIDGTLQSTSSGIPIVYYKSGTSYIYIEPNQDKYVYKVLSNPTNVVEYLVNIQ